MRMESLRQMTKDVDIATIPWLAVVVDVTLAGFALAFPVVRH